MKKYVIKLEKTFRCAGDKEAIAAVQKMKSTLPKGVKLNVLCIIVEDTLSRVIEHVRYFR